MLKFDYDAFDNQKENKILLANPNKKYIGQLENVKNLKIYDRFFGSVSEITFDIYKNLNGIENIFYDKIKGKRLIEIYGIGWFQIKDVSDKIEGFCTKVNGCKSVTAKSLEYELLSRKIYNIDGIYKLYDTSDNAKSLMHIVCDNCGWTIGTVDNSLLDKWRTFSIDETVIYSFLMENVSKSFDCIFEFNTYTKQINAKPLSCSGENTNIFLSYKNLLNECEIDTDADKIITKLSVMGDDSVDIRAVNPTGTNYIVNYDYFMTTEWVSQSLINAWNNWKNAFDSAQSTYMSSLNMLKNKTKELTILNSQLVELESNLKASREVVGGLIQSLGKAPDYTNPNYINYQNALTQVNTYTSQIQLKQTRISSKEQEISAINYTLTSIGTSLNINNYLSSDNINELESITIEGEDYVDDTFIVTDEMSDEEIIEMKLNLYSNGASELSRASQPQYTIKIGMKNLFTISDNNSTFSSYKDWRSEFIVGNIVNVKIRENYITTARIMEIVYDFEDREKIEVTISDKSRFDDVFTELSGILANSSSASKSYSLNKFGYNKSKDMNDDVSSFIYGSLNATNNNIKNNTNQEMLIDTYGAWYRKWLPEIGIYSPKQSLWNGNNLLFTDDGWNTTKCGIGEFVDDNNNSYYGVIADVLVGRMILGNGLKISNSSGNFSIDSNGFSAVSGNYSVCINPNTPSDIFSIKIGNTNALCVDIENNKLKFSGELEAATGTFSGTLNAGVSISSPEVMGGNFTGGTFTGNSFTGGTFTGGTFNGATMIGANLTSVTSSWRTEITGGLTKTSMVHVRPVYNAGSNVSEFNDGIGGINIDYDMIQVYNSTGKIATLTPVNLSIYTINDGIPITTSNLGYYTSGYVTQSTVSSMLGDYATLTYVSGLYNSLSQRISALE